MQERSLVLFAGPLYEQVQKIIKSRILAGEWHTKEALPGEAALSEELGVSVGTVRRAMDQLAREHILIRERGRGTFVRGDANAQSQAAWRLCDQHGHPIQPDIRLTDCVASAASSNDTADLKLGGRQKFAPRVLKLRREWHFQGKLLCRETLMVEEVRFLGLRQAINENDETLFSTYADVYRTKVDGIQWAILAPPRGSGAPSSREFEFDAPVMVFRRTALDSRGVPIEACEQWVSLACCQVHIAS